MSLTFEEPALRAAVRPERNYLTEDGSLSSWLFTTDHKRIALLYLGTITVFFFIGGAAAALMRLQLFTPGGYIVAPETYNRLFTMHGVIMVWFFLVPALPVTLGNFVIPLMLGARDLAFPRINLLSWYLFVAGGLVALVRTVRRRARHRLDVLHAALHQLRAGRAGRGHGRHLPRRIFLDRDRAELHRHHPSPARAGHDVLSDAAVPVVAVRHQRHLRAGHAGAGDHADPAGVRACLPCRRVRSRARRRSAAVPAPVLVLLAPGGVHHDPAGHGRGQRDHHHFRAEGHLRLQVHRLVQHLHRGDRLLRVGPPHVRRRHLHLLQHRVLAAELSRSQCRRPSRCSTGSARCTRASSASTRRCCMRSASSGCSRWAD